jgi:hypothetical protein
VSCTRSSGSRLRPTPGNNSPRQAGFATQDVPETRTVSSRGAAPFTLDVPLVHSQVPEDDDAQD